MKKTLFSVFAAVLTLGVAPTALHGTDAEPQAPAIITNPSADALSTVEEAFRAAPMIQPATLGSAALGREPQVNIDMASGNPNAARASERGFRMIFTYPTILSADSNVEFTKSFIAADDAPYQRFCFTVKALHTPVKIERITFFDHLKLPGIKRIGNTDGAVVQGENFFIGIEHPMAKIEVKDGAELTAYINRNFELKPGETWSFSFVFGTTVPGQERRMFQAYLENERPRPYHVFPHYNSWYDLCIGRNDNADPLKRMTEESALTSMRKFNQELYKKRGVHIESYLLDDGWDDWDTLWDYHKGFPHKFDTIYKEVKSQKSGISAWLSPWGGYGGSKGRRVANAKKIGLETPGNQLSLAQPKYYEAFRNRCLQMIKDYNMNMFKFDGIGAGTYATGANDAIAPDLEGLVRLIGELREAKPDLFINCTVGTWASPFWLFYADAIWRGGEDCSYTGKGLPREQWITYRDKIIYDRFASVSPYFPLNSIMFHGLIVGNRSVPSRMDVSASEASTRAFANEVWMSVGGGSQLQEYYISPDLMHEQWWDLLASGIKWLRANEKILRDVHWCGGSPSKGEVYGYASYSPKKAILLLRNPSENAQKFTGNYGTIFEIPAENPQKVKKVKQVYASTLSDKQVKTYVGDAINVELPPFEVILLELTF